MNKVITISQRTGVSTFASPTSPRIGQSLQKSFHLSNADKIELKKISSPSENKKYATAQTNTTKTITVKLNRDNGLQTRTTEHQQVTAVAVAQLHFKKIKQPIGRVYSLDIFLNYIFTVEKLDDFIITNHLRVCGTL